MVFDSDVIIWTLRRHGPAIRAVDEAAERAVSIITCMEVFRGARDRQEVRDIKEFLRDMDFRVLPLTENIGHRALIYVETYALKGGLSPDDALVAATAVENSLPLCTANDKHLKAVEDLQLVVFRP